MRTRSSTRLIARAMKTATSCGPKGRKRPNRQEIESAKFNATRRQGTARIPKRRKGEMVSKDQSDNLHNAAEAESPWYRKFVPEQDGVYQNYMENEWGYPEFDDQRLFEMLILEGAQAGLSWATILKKRQGYQKAFHNFEIKKVAAMTPEDELALLNDPSIVRNKLKIKAAVKNARGSLKIIEEHGSLSKYLWSFVGGRPMVNHWGSFQEVPVKTAEAEEMSKALKKRGFSFVGPTILYAFMQACGMVLDHPVGTPQHKKVLRYLKNKKLLEKR
mmetsp:Transcript_38116/g.61915  ORF Transcript_38116/g.61915 Transcript_38116/m.61915 type:complete len:274 (+) Transcript_38116:301-1122(+)|eukprot:jgi/Bigna1/55048/estExt_Genewise1Plus.C_490078